MMANQRLSRLRDHLEGTTGGGIQVRKRACVRGWLSVCLGVGGLGLTRVHVC